MSNAPATNGDAYSGDSERDDVLNAIHTKWGRFNRQELSKLKTFDDVVAHVVAKYDLQKGAAEREVKILLAGRRIAP
jgi:hypothetical protein